MSRPIAPYAQFLALVPPRDQWLPWRHAPANTDEAVRVCCRYAWPALKRLGIPYSSMGVEDAVQQFLEGRVTVNGRRINAVVPR